MKKLEKEEAKKAQLYFIFDEKLFTYKKMLFGKSSEKRKVSDRHRKKEKKKLLLEGESLAPAPKKEELKDLEVIEVRHSLTEEELSSIAEEYGYPRDSEWEKLSIYDESEEIDIKVQSYVRKKHRSYKYRLKKSKNSHKEIIVTASSPKRIVPGSSYSPELAVDVVSEKYLYHLPLERIRRKMEAKGLNVFSKTLYSLCSFVSFYLEDIAQSIRKDLLEGERTLHIDETPWPINNGREKDGYMWVMSHEGGSYYHFAPTRSAIVAKEFLGSYRGPVLTDGYSSYKSHLDSREGIELASCWAHARRKLVRS